jgi:hypothetical protein
MKFLGENAKFLSGSMSLPAGKANLEAGKIHRRRISPSMNHVTVVAPRFDSRICVRFDLVDTLKK